MLILNRSRGIILMNKAVNGSNLKLMVSVFFFFFFKCESD
jgi:hypothetical protein